MLRAGQVVGLSSQPDTLHTGCNGGYQTVNMAVLAGGARIVLVGYDMRYVDGRSNWHTPHPVASYESWYSDVYRPQFKQMGALPKGVSILNASPDSALTCFPKVPLESILPDP